MADLSKFTSERDESVVVGSLLVSDEECQTVFNLIAPSDFYSFQYIWIFEAMLYCHNAEQPIDVMTVASRLSDQGRLQRIGGEVYLVSLTLLEDAATALHVVAYAQRVRDLSRRRRMAQTIERCAQMVYDQTIPNDRLSAEVNRCVSETFSLLTSRKHAQPIKDVMKSYVKSIETRNQNPKSAAGIATGFSGLDLLLGGGLKPGQLIVMAARPGLGKTSASHAMVSNMSMGQYRGAIYTLEMTNEECVARFVASATGINTQRLDNGALQDHEWDSVTTIASKISDWPLWLCDSPMRIDEIHRSAEQIQRLHGLDYLVIDYLGLVDSPGKTDYERASSIAWGAKQIAKDLHIPVLLNCQLSRAVEQRDNKRPILSDLRDSGKIEEHSDIVLGLYRDDYYYPDTDHKNIAEILILKQRNGPIGKVDLYFNKELTKFANLAREKIAL